MTPNYRGIDTTRMQCYWQVCDQDGGGDALTKSEDIMKSLDEEELRILLLCFSKPKVLEALRIYHKIPGHGKQAFFDTGKRRIASERMLYHKKLLDGGE